MSGANGTKARMAWIALGALTLNACSFLGGYVFSAGRNEQRLAAVEDYIKVHQAWSTQRSDVLSQSAYDVQQVKQDIRDIRTDMREIRAIVDRIQQRQGAGR